jgi:hypothetical protein
VKVEVVVAVLVCQTTEVAARVDFTVCVACDPPTVLVWPAQVVTTVLVLVCLARL